MKALCTIVCLLLAGDALSAAGQAGQPGGVSVWENSVITIEIARNQYDYNQPWSRKTRRLKKTGVVLDEKHVLTTADQLSDSTLIRLQKHGGGEWYLGQIAWVDYPANLALLTSIDTNFWRGVEPAALKSSLPEGGNLQILRWREGNLEKRRAEFNQYTVREGPLSPISYAVLETSSDIQNAGWGEPVVADGHVMGISMAQDGRNCIAIPASFINSVIDAVKKKEYRGLGFFHFYWQPAENTASLSALGLPGAARGVIIHFIPERPDHAAQVLKTNDIILSIDGFPLDTEGDYVDPEFGHLLLENLATRQKWAGAETKMRIWRDGQELDVTYRLPKFQYTNSLLPFATPDQAPEYLMMAGLVFQPLDQPFLQTWGADWKRRAPFRLYYYNNQFPTRDRPALILLSQVLPDPFNIGYQDLRYLVVDKVNGIRVNYLADLREALQKPSGGFHVIEFVKSDNLRRMVVAAGDLEAAATDRTMKRYGLPEAFHFNGALPVTKPE